MIIEPHTIYYMIYNYRTYHYNTLFIKLLIDVSFTSCLRHHPNLSPPTCCGVLLPRPSPKLCLSTARIPSLTQEQSMAAVGQYHVSGGDLR